MNNENFWWEIIVEGEQEVLLSLVDLSGSIGANFESDNRAKAYYRSSESVEHWKGAILALFPDAKIVGHGKIENRPWHTEWKDAFPPLEVGENFVVLAPWHKNEVEISSDKIPIYIYPATAFGTGYHESTQIALTLLEKNKSIIKNNFVADIGTGSGVLLIAALKLGAARGLARDIDPTVLDEVRRNMNENGLDESRACLEVGDLLTSPTPEVKILTANILFEPLCSMLPDVPKVLDEDGVAIFAGLLLREREKFLDATSQSGLSLVEEISKNEWWGASFCLSR